MRASPVFADLTGLPPLLVQVGTAETLLDDSAELARCASEADVEVRYEAWPGMPHVWHMFGAMLTEAREAIAGGVAFCALKTA
jgi:acetyl esterase/lipase